MVWGSPPLSCESCYREIRLEVRACGLHSGEMSLEPIGMSGSLGRIGERSKQRLACSLQGILGPFGSLELLLGFLAGQGPGVLSILVL